METEKKVNTLQHGIKRLKERMGWAQEGWSRVPFSSGSGGRLAEEVETGESTHRSGSDCRCPGGFGGRAGETWEMSVGEEHCKWTYWCSRNVYEEAVGQPRSSYTRPG